MDDKVIIQSPQQSDPPGTNPPNKTGGFTTKGRPVPLENPQQSDPAKGNEEPKTGSFTGKGKSAAP